MVRDAFTQRQPCGHQDTCVHPCMCAVFHPASGGADRAWACDLHMQRVSGAQALKEDQRASSQPLKLFSSPASERLACLQVILFNLGNLPG